MGQKTKKGKGRLDKFYHLAKEQGYRSRAAFKLIQLNRKYNFLSNCRALLDLCAAPGGWLQVAAKNMPLASLIIGVDLVPIKPIRGVKTLIGDITTQACRAALRKEANGASFDVVVHDGAPNVGGAWANEAYTQAALVLESLRLATEFLPPKGTFVTKVFRSKDYNALLYAFNQLFDRVEATKPTASRNTSAEIFVVCQGYKAPAKIDPRLLDPRHLFQEVGDAKKVMGPEALLKLKVKQRRHREGYEDGLSTSHKASSALAFLVSDTPVEMLGSVTQLALEGPNSWAPVEGLGQGDLKELADAVRRHASTDKEIRALCADLQVLGRSEFKALLRWRLGLRKALAKELKAARGEEGDSDEEEGKKAKAAAGEAKTGEEALLEEMAAVKEALEKKAKKEKKKAREAKQKSRIRAAHLAQGEGILDETGPEELFSLGAVEGGKGVLKKVVEREAPGDAELALLEEDSEESMESGSDDEGSGYGSDLDSEDEARLRYEAELEDALEDSYAKYLERKGHREDVAKEKRKRLGKGGELDSDEEEGAAGAGAGAAAADGYASDEDGEEGDSEEGLSEGEEDDDMGLEEEAQPAKKGKGQGEKRKGAGLLVSLDESRAGVAKSSAAMAAQWFGQELFDDPNLVADDEEEEEAGPGPSSKKQQAAAAAGKKGKAAAAEAAAAAAANGKKAGKAGSKAAAAAEAGQDEDEEDGEDDVHASDAKAAAAEAKAAGKKRAAKDAGGFEVVPQDKKKARKGAAAGAASDSGSESETDSEDEYDMLDDQGKAEVLALAKRMLRRKDKESIVDAAYNRYAFHDTGLPRWFREDEMRHMAPIIPVTKEEVEEEKARLRAIDARPIKKVAQAKARQRKKMLSKLQQAREKAEAVAAQEDVPMASKMREIERLYAKARAAGKKRKGGKGKDGKGKGGKGDGKRRGPPVDKRMLKDKRAQKAHAKKAGKGGKGKGGGRKSR